MKPWKKERNKEMAEYRFKELVEICDGLVSGKDIALPFETISLDSRKLGDPTHTLFVAIAGPHHDGHTYINELYQRGVRQFIIEKDVDISRFPDAAFCSVNSSVKALQKLASFHRRKFDIPVFGITGSNGKTVVKEWLNTLLAGDYRIVRSPRSYNSQVGVPLSVWNLDSQRELAIFEAGISKPGEMEALAEIIRPTVGIFTHLGNAHLENFASQKQLVEEKAKLFTSCESLVFCSDVPELREVFAASEYRDVQKITWGYQSTELSADSLWIRKCESEAQITFLWCEWMKAEVHYTLPFTDAASIENAISCIAVLHSLKFSHEQIQERLQRLSALQMRLEVIEGINHCTIVNDAYSNDLHSLEIALDFLKSNQGNKSSLAILSDIVQSGMADEDLYARMNQLLLSKGIDQLIGIGPGMSAYSKIFSVPAVFYTSTEEFLSSFQTKDVSEKAILIKGARVFRFEEIVKRWQKKTHETRLEVDLAAMLNNLNYFRSKLKSGTKLMVMVKAFGYGSGAREVSSMLQFNRVDYLAVAYADEGVELRKAGISLPIMVMNPEPGSYGTMIRYHLEPEIYSLHVLKLFLEELRFHVRKNPYPIHIKLDTGMHRLGFLPGDFTSLSKILGEEKSIRVASVFTHLSSTENPSHDDFTKKQLHVFDEGCASLSKVVGNDFLRHALNTGGIQRFPDAQYDMVRLGIGLYGVASYSEEQKSLQAVSSFLSKISQIKEIQKGDVVGYALSFVADKSMRIAIVPVGYADGLRRSLSNGRGYLSIRGQKAPILGRVCMDMVMVDVSSISCIEGDDVEIFGTHISLSEFASLCDTIPYEILTSVSQRVKRVYLQE
jgi:alanine racemase